MSFNAVRTLIEMVMLNVTHWDLELENALYVSLNLFGENWLKKLCFSQFLKLLHKLKLVFKDYQARLQ